MSDDEVRRCIEAIKLDPEEAPLYFSRGIEHMREKDFALAIGCMSQAITLETGGSFPHTSTGVPAITPSDINRGPTRTSTSLSSSVPTMPKPTSAGEIQRMEIGSKDMALSDYNMALELDPKMAAAYVNRGNYYLDTRNFDLAIRDYDRALELGLCLPQVHYSRGKAHLSVGCVEDAVS